MSWNQSTRIPTLTSPQLVPSAPYGYGKKKKKVQTKLDLVHVAPVTSTAHTEEAEAESGVKIAAAHDEADWPSRVVSPTIGLESPREKLEVSYNVLEAITSDDVGLYIPDHSVYTPSLAPVVTPPSFRDQRPMIFRQIHTDVMSGGKMADVDISLYTRRTSTGQPYQPKVLSVSQRLLSAASPQFVQHIFSAQAERESDYYASDSDLEEDDELGSTRDRVFPSRTSKVQPTSLGPQSGATSLKFDSEEEEEEEQVSPPKHHTKFKAISRRTHRYADNIAHDGAFRTWQAMVLYLYDLDDHILFKPLKSSLDTSVVSGNDSDVALSENVGDAADTWPCSPKSMYRLACKFELEELKHLAKASIEGDLTEKNIIRELFSDFTWRYADIIQMEIEVFMAYAHSPIVMDALGAVFEKIEKGEYPHSSSILKSLFASLVRRGTRRASRKST